MTELTASRLRELLHYDPSTGEFFWRTAWCRKIKAGAKAGTTDKRGYIDIRIDGEKHRAHRLAILYMTGEWPADCVDHANRVNGDNRYQNLRQCTTAQNNSNRRVLRETATGVKGVSLADGGKFRARICADRNRRLIGVFESAEQAGKAYEDAAKRVHGEFACL